MKAIGMRTGGHGGKHVGLRVPRDAIEQPLVANHRECPRLSVYRARRLHGRIDHTTDGVVIDCCIRVFTHRAPSADCIVEFHGCVLLVNGHAVKAGADLLRITFDTLAQNWATATKGFPRSRRYEEPDSQGEEPEFEGAAALREEL